MIFRHFSRALRLSVICTSAALGAATLAAAHPGQRWELNSFREFAEGTLSDGGVNSLIAADGTLRLINAFDLNRDGLPDIFLPSNGADSSVVDLSIYWDQPGYDPKDVTRLPTEGGKDAAVADLNRDGWPDLVVVSNFDGTKNELNAYIYWGSQRGFSTDARSTLLTQGAEGIAIDDLNADGWPDIVIANSGLTYHVAIDKIQQSYIYWNRHGKFSAEERTTLPTINGRDVAIADLNADNAPDVVLVSAGNDPPESGARIFWSQGGNFDVAHSLFLPGQSSAAVALGDLNNDGRPELVLVNSHRLKGREGGIYNIVDTVHLDSLIYWNTPEGFATDRRTGLPTIAGQDAAIGDLDGDRWPEVIFANGSADSSFVYWGSAEGFLPRHRLALTTNSAHAVQAADLNRDGHVDLIFANNSKDAHYDTDSFIYWGASDGPSEARRQALPTSGAGAIVIADLRNQSRNDVVFINKNDATGSNTSSSLYFSDRTNPEIFSPANRMLLETIGVDAYSAADLNLDGRPDLVIPGTDGVSIYWANETGYDRDRRKSIISNYAFSTRLADFNRDGFVDMMMSEWRPGSSQTHLYYGSPNGFGAAARTALPVGGIRFHTIGDFNADGWIDVAFPMFNEQMVSIFWNGPSGFTSERRTDLPGRSPVALEVADLNADGHLDLIVPNLFDKNPPPENKTRAFGGSPKGDVFLYWGSKDGFSNDRRTTLPALGAEDAVAADFNNDKRLDLAITAYHGGTRRDFPSYVYWQDEDGFDAKKVSMLETFSASGGLAADFNADGWADLLFANHHRNGTHRNLSFLYWGSPDGFSAKRRVELPADGPHLMTVVDHGNVHDRSHDYHYLSPAKAFKSVGTLRAINWTADTPPGTSVRFQIRSASSAEALAEATWTGPEGNDSAFHSPSSAAKISLNGGWVQFRATLSNPGGGLPVVQAVTLDFE